MALTQDQQQSVNDSGGYYDPSGNWVDMSSASGASQGGTAGGGSSQWIQQLLQALAGMGGAVAGHAVSQNAGQNAVPPELRQLLQIGTDRAAYQNPMFQAVNQGAYKMLPDFAKEGTSLSGTLSNQPPPVSGGGGGMNPLAAGGLGALAGLGAGGGKIPIDQIIKALGDLFKKKGRDTVLGNQNRVPQLNPGDNAYDPNGFMGWAPWGKDLGDANTVDNSFTGWSPGPPLTPNVSSDWQWYPPGYDPSNPSGDPYGAPGDLGGLPGFSQGPF